MKRSRLRRLTIAGVLLAAILVKEATGQQASPPEKLPDEDKIAQMLKSDEPQQMADERAIAIA